MGSIKVIDRIINLFQNLDHSRLTEEQSELARRLKDEVEWEIVIDEFNSGNHNRLRNIFKDDESYELALKLFKYLDITGEGDECTITKRKPGVLIAAMQAIIEKNLLNDEKKWSLANTYPHFQQHFKVSWQSEPDRTSKLFKDNIEDARNFLRRHLKNPL